MGYARLDDSFWINEKVDALSDKAFRLYVRSISFASALNTDGIITKRSLRALEGTPAIAAQLVKAGVWDARGDSVWEIHNYTVHNSSAEERKKRAQSAANSRWKPDAKRMQPASVPHVTSDAEGMQPASHVICEPHASQLISTQLISTHSKADQVVPQKAATAARERLTDEQREKLLHDFAGLPDVSERIDEALNHTAAKKAKNEYLYLRAWLRRDFEQLPPNRSKPNGNRNGRTGVPEFAGWAHPIEPISSDPDFLAAVERRNAGLA